VPPGPPFGPADRELVAARHARTTPVPASRASFAHAATGVHPRVKAKALPGAGGPGSMTSCGHGASRARWDRVRAKVAPAPAHRIRIGSRRRTSRLRGELVLDPHQRPRQASRPFRVPATPAQPAITPTSREPSLHTGLRPLAVARPGLEPGTPRFSVVHVFGLRTAKSLELAWLGPGQRPRHMVAI
jgi:hypothetical protein